MSNYTLNFAPIELQGATEVLAGRQAYSADRLRELRSEFYRTHIFQRFGEDDVIIDIPIAPGHAPIGNIQERLDLASSQRLWPALLSAALLRAFEGQRDITSASPVCELGNIQERLDLASSQRLWPALLSAALLRAFEGQRDITSASPVCVLGNITRGLIEHPKLPASFQKRTALEFDTRSIYPAGGKRLLGVVCENARSQFYQQPMRRANKARYTAFSAHAEDAVSAAPGTIAK